MRTMAQPQIPPNEEEEEIFRTKDMALVVFLNLQKISSIGMSKVEISEIRTEVYWHFIDSDRLRDLLDDYLQGRGLVEPQAFSDTFVRVRNEMFDYLRRS